MRSNEFLVEESELERVMRQPKTNEWIVYGPFSLYIRVGQRYIEGQRLRVVDLANFEISDERERGKGHFSALLNDVNALGKKYGYAGIYVESILNDDLVPILKRKGFRIVNNDMIPSMYREIQ